jgi:predicted nucleotidyltransferase
MVSGVAHQESLLREIVRRILRVSQPRRIILFGSAATGRLTPDSDIDLLVLEDAPQDPRQESVRLRESLRDIEYPFDILVMSTDRFEETKDLVGGIAFPAHRYGKVLYEAA